MLAGLQGAGKTTLAGKLAKWLKGQGHTPLLWPAICSAPARSTSSRSSASAPASTSFAPHPGTAPDAADTEGAGPGDPVAVAAAGLAEAQSKHFDVVIVDKPPAVGHRRGAHGAGLRDPRRRAHPTRPCSSLDAMIGQDAVATAEAFGSGVVFTGVVLTKLDGDARGGAALSVREVTGDADSVRVRPVRSSRTSTSSTPTGWPAASWAWAMF